MSMFILATGGYDTSVRFFDATNQSVIRTLQFCDQHVIRLAFSGDGPVAADEPLYLAVAGSPTICVYDVSTNDTSPNVFAPYKEHSEAVTAVGFEPKHTAFVYSASEDGTLQTWLPELAHSPGQQTPGAIPAYQTDTPGHDGVASLNGGLGLFQPSGEPFTPAKFLNDGPGGLVAIHDATYYPPEELFFTVDALGRLRVWDHSDGSMRTEIVPHHSRRNLQCLELSADYRTLVLANFDGYVFVYKVERLLADPENVRSVSFRGNSTYITRVRLSVSANLLVCTTRSGSTKVFRMADVIGSNSSSEANESSGDAMVTPAREFAGHPGWVWDAAFVGDGEDYLFTCSSNTQVMLWALNDMRNSTEYGGHEKAVVCLAVKERAGVSADQFGLDPTTADQSLVPPPYIGPFRNYEDIDNEPVANGSAHHNVNGGAVASETT